MNCPYIFKAEDAPVKDGKRKVGDVCNDLRGSAKHNGYCMAHVRQMGMLSEEEIAAEQAKRAETKQKMRDRTPEEIAAGAAGYNKTVLEAMNLNDPCDLASEYSVFKSLNLNPTYENYDQKMAFARWLRTPRHLRTPQIIEDAAVILGVKAQTLYNWKSSPDIVRFINLDAENRALAMFPFAMYKLGCGVDRGDASSIKLYKEWYEEKMASRNKKEKTLDLPDDMAQEAIAYANATGKQNRGQSLVSEKNMVVDNHFVGDGLIGEDEQ